MELNPFRFPLVMRPMPPPYHLMFTASEDWPEGSLWDGMIATPRVGVYIPEIMVLPGRVRAKITLVRCGDYLTTPDSEQLDLQEKGTAWLQLRWCLGASPDAVVAHEVSYQKTESAMVFDADGEAITNEQLGSFDLGLPLSLVVDSVACDMHPPMVVWPIK